MSKEVSEIIFLDRSGLGCRDKRVVVRKPLKALTLHRGQAANGYACYRRWMSSGCQRVAWVTRLRVTPVGLARYLRRVETDGILLAIIPAQGMRFLADDWILGAVNGKGFDLKVNSLTSRRQARGGFNLPRYSPASKAGYAMLLASLKGEHRVATTAYSEPGPLVCC